MSDMREDGLEMTGKQRLRWRKQDAMLIRLQPLPMPEGSMKL